MAITADILYPRLLEATGSTPIGLEKRIGLGNGVIAKAITNKSNLRAGTLALLLRAFPDLNPGFLEDGRLPLFIPADSKDESTDAADGGLTGTAEPLSPYARKTPADGWKDKYLALLEQQVKDQALLLQTASAAIEAAQATIGFIHKLPAEFVGRGVFQQTESRLAGLRFFTLRQLSQLSGKPPADLEAELRQAEESTGADE